MIPASEIVHDVKIDDKTIPARASILNSIGVAKLTSAPREAQVFDIAARRLQFGAGVTRAPPRPRSPSNASRARGMLATMAALRVGDDPVQFLELVSPAPPAPARGVMTSGEGMLGLPEASRLGVDADVNARPLRRAALGAFRRCDDLDRKAACRAGDVGAVELSGLRRPDVTGA